MYLDKSINDKVWIISSREHESIHLGTIIKIEVDENRKVLYTVKWVESIFEDSILYSTLKMGKDDVHSSINCAIREMERDYEKRAKESEQLFNKAKEIKERLKNQPKPVDVNFDEEVK